MKNILVAGSLAFDYIMDYQGVFSDSIMPDKIHKINLSFLLTEFKKQKGGTAGNIAYNLSLLNRPSAIFACAGNDFSDYLSFLKKANIDVSNIQIIKDKKTASAFIMTDKKDNQITGFYPGAMTDSYKFSLNNLNYSPSLVLITPNSPEAIIRQARECRELNFPFVIDMGMQLPALKPDEIRDILKKAKILIGNDYEIGLLKSKSSLKESDLAEEIEIVITTLGEKGSIIQTKNERIQVNSAKPREVIDPTGAGDAYRAGFAAGFQKGLSLRDCGQMGSVLSSFAVEKYGTQEHKFTIDDFEKRYRANFGGNVKI